MSRAPLLLLMAAWLLLPAACGPEAAPAPAATGRYALDQKDYARRLAAEHLENKDGSPRADVSAAQRDKIRSECVARARKLTLALELRGDGAFMARYADGQTSQRLGGTWEQEGADVIFHTTAIPGGRVTSIPTVRARQTAEGLAFGGDVSGWVVPHAFLLRKVD